MVSSHTARAGVLILASAALGASALPVRDGPSVFARDAVSAVMQKRAIMKGDNYVPLGHTTIPLSPLLLVLAGLGAAVAGLVIVLLRIFCPSWMSRSARIVLQERERARQDLRVRGASPRVSPGGSPTPGGSTPTHTHARRFPPNKPPRPVGRNSRGSFPAIDSSTSSLNSKRLSHGYRGTSFSLADARKNTDKSYRSSYSALQMPVLNSSESSSGSSTLHNARDSAMTERAKYPITATNEPSALGGKALHFGTKYLQRTSSTGKGADLQRTRSGRRNAEIALAPQAVDRAYPQPQQWRRRESNSHHPLQTATSRRDSTLSMQSSSAEQSYLESNGTSRVGSYTNMSGNPLQPLSMSGLGSGAHASQPWASPRSTSRSSSPDFASPDPSRLAVAHSPTGNSRNSSASGLLDSDGSDHGVTPQTTIMVPSRYASSRK